VSFSWTTARARRRKDPEFYQGVIEDKFLNDLTWDINEKSARLCREWADRVANKTGRPRFVAGAIGRSRSLCPTRRMRTMRVSHDHVRSSESRLRAAGARPDRGRADLLLVETIFDSLNGKARSWRSRKCSTKRAGNCL